MAVDVVSNLPMSPPRFGSLLPHLYLATDFFGIAGVGVVGTLHPMRVLRAALRNANNLVVCECQSSLEPWTRHNNLSGHLLAHERCVLLAPDRGARLSC